MSSSIEAYLDEVRVHLHLDKRNESKVLQELTTHFQEKVMELEWEGLSREEANREAIDSFGAAKAIARLMDEAYSRGSWMDALLACQPHFIIALLFATHFWHNPFILGLTFVTITIVTLLGWQRGSPVWMYSWAGYAFFPFLIAAFLSRHPISSTFTFLTAGTGAPTPAWQIGILLVLLAFVVWLIVTASVHVAKRDWLFLSLILLPLPVLGIWALTVESTGDSLFRLFQSEISRFGRWDSAMAFFCLFLGITSALFVRLRQRVLKAGAILVIGIVGGVLVVRSFWTDIGILQLFAVSVGLFLFLTLPYLLHSLFAHSPLQKEADTEENDQEV
jgi:hypothetical protein